MIHHYIKKERQYAGQGFGSGKIVVDTYCGMTLTWRSKPGGVTPQGHDACYTINALENRERPGNTVCAQCANDPKAALAALAQTEL